MNPASLHAVAPADFKAEFITTKGDFVVEVHKDWAPLGADRFYNLVRGGFFTNAAFFRVVPNFMVQFGLNANPAVNDAWRNANLARRSGEAKQQARLHHLRHRRAQHAHHAALHQFQGQRFPGFAGIRAVWRSSGGHGRGG